MDKAIILDLAKRLWKYGVILGLLIIIYFLFNSTKGLENKVEDAVSKAKEHEIKAVFYKGLYDKLIEEDNALEVKYDSLVQLKNNLKPIYYEKLKVVNLYTVSDWQQFYDERAIKGSESSNP